MKRDAGAKKPALCAIAFCDGQGVPLVSGILEPPNGPARLNNPNDLVDLRVKDRGANADERRGYPQLFGHR